MDGLTGNITILSIIIIAAIILVTVAIFVMFAILCSNISQIKRILIKINDEVSKKRKNQISVGYLRPKI